ncbi:MAG: hypothetical protein JSS75_04545 [Bacteroidetes bacterium]|nr:hypothetical protein [Bacteroidota bacterium]
MNETPNVSELSDIGRVAGNVRSNEKLGGIGACTLAAAKNCGLFETRQSEAPLPPHQLRCAAAAALRYV